MTASLPKKSTQSARQNAPPGKRCWKGAGAHLKPENFKIDNPKAEETTMSRDDSTNETTTSSLVTQKTRFATTP